MIRPFFIIFFFLILFSCSSQESLESEDNSKFFSREVINAAEKKYLAPVEYIKSSDGISLSYRSYIPDKPKAVLIFYHGGGAHSGLTYNHIGAGLRDSFDIVVIMPDMRGHGFSEGPRGDAPTTEQVWKDINSIISHISAIYPDLPVFLGGHSGGAGLSLNYSSWDKKLPIKGYVFLAPYFGYLSKTEHDPPKIKFGTVNVFAFIVNALSGGYLLGHSKAVKYSFPPDVLKKNPKRITFNTVNMAKAATPSNPQEQFSQLDRFGLWIGSQDEAFDPVKIIEFAKKNSNKNANTKIVAIDKETHLSIILKAHKFIGPWIHNQIRK